MNNEDIIFKSQENVEYRWSFFEDYHGHLPKEAVKFIDILGFEKLKKSYLTAKSTASGSSPEVSALRLDEEKGVI